MGIHNNTPLNLNANQQKLYNRKKIKTLFLYPEYYLIKVNNFDDIKENSNRCTLDRIIEKLHSKTLCCRRMNYGFAMLPINLKKLYRKYPK